MKRHDLGQYPTELSMTSLVCKVGLCYSSASVNQLFNTKKSYQKFDTELFEINKRDYISKVTFGGGLSGDLYYFVLFYFILFYFILFYFILFYSILFYFILFYFIFVLFHLFYFILFFFLYIYYKCEYLNTNVNKSAKD